MMGEVTSVDNNGGSTSGTAGVPDVVLSAQYDLNGNRTALTAQVNVGSGKSTDRSPVIDVPQLPNVAYSAPYLHDGSARSLEEIWTVFNPKDTHGVSNDLTKDELNDLIEYLKTL